jgi:hypothetical protein
VRGKGFPLADGVLGHCGQDLGQWRACGWILPCSHKRERDHCVILLPDKNPLTGTCSAFLAVSLDIACMAANAAWKRNKKVAVKLLL